MTAAHWLGTCFERTNVEGRWTPRRLRCLVVGESPGAPGSSCFYDPIPFSGDPVKVRSLLLQGLRHENIIDVSSLEAFKEAGFLFDHAIREQLDMAQVQVERDRAKKFTSKFAESATHLPPLIEKAESVWAMGDIARNAMLCFFPSIPREHRPLTPPYRLSEKIFTSRYFTRFTNQELVNEIVGRVSRFIPRS